MTLNLDYLASTPGNVNNSAAVIFLELALTHRHRRDAAVIPRRRPPQQVDI
jgi:hypothetical protein